MGSSAQPAPPGAETEERGAGVGMRIDPATGDTIVTRGGYAIFAGTAAAAAEVAAREALRAGRDAVRARRWGRKRRGAPPAAGAGSPQPEGAGA